MNEGVGPVSPAWKSLLARHGGWLAVLAAAGLFYWQWLLGKSFIWEDLLFMWYPALCHQADALAHFRLPLWNPGLRCGMPFCSDVEVGEFYPPHWLFAFLSDDGRVPWLAYQWYLVAHVFVSGLGIYLFLREQGLRRSACAVGGTTFSLGGFMSMHMMHGPFLISMSWVPLALFWLKRTFKSGRRSALGGVCVAMVLSFLAGAPQVTLYSSLLIVAYWCFLAFQGAGAEGRVRGRALRVAALEMAVVFGVTLAIGGAVLLPSLVDWAGSGRSGFSFAQIADTSVPWYYLVTLLFPNFFGVSNAGGEGVRFWGINRDTIEFKTWNMAPWQYWEFAGYAGQLAICGAVLAFAGWRSWKDRPEVRFFAVWAVFSLWFMLGRYGGLFQVMYAVVPGVGMFRSPSRMSCGLTLAGAVLAAHLVDMALNGQGIGLIRRLFKFMLLGCVAALLLFLFMGQGLAEPLKDPSNFDRASFEIVRAAVINAALLLWARDIMNGGKMLKGVAAPGLPLLIVMADLYLAHAHFHRGRQNPEEYYADRAGIVPRIVEMQRKEGPFRFAQMREGRLSEEVVFPRNAAYIYAGLEVPEGYVTFTPKRIGEFHGMKNDAAKLDIMNARLLANIQDRRLVLGMNATALPRARAYHACQEYGSWAELLAAIEGGSLDYRSRLGLIRGEAGDLSGLFGGGTEAPAPVSLERRTPEKMRLKTRMAAPGAIFISQTYYSGWRARDGAGRALRVVPGFGAFTAILVPSPGDIDITFEYRPRELYYGLALSFIGVGAGLGLWWAVRRREGARATGP